MAVDRGRVLRAAAGRNDLVDADGRAVARAARRLERTRGDHHEVVVGREPRKAALAHDRAVAPAREREPVAEIDELEHGLQVVVTILTTAEHVQEQVQLRGRKRVERPHPAAHSSTTTRIFAPSRSATMTPGSTTPSCSV